MSAAGVRGPDITISRSFSLSFSLSLLEENSLPSLPSDQLLMSLSFSLSLSLSFSFLDDAGTEDDGDAASCGAFDGVASGRCRGELGAEKVTDSRSPPAPELPPAAADASAAGLKYTAPLFRLLSASSEIASPSAAKSSLKYIPSEPATASFEV